MSPTSTPSAPGTLLPLPAAFEATRESLHDLAELVLSPARKEATGRIGLVPTPGGFGTPPFGDGPTQLRVEGLDLVVSEGGRERRAPLTTLRAAGELAGGLVPDAHSLPSAELALDAESATRLADLYALGGALMERLRAAARPDDQVTVATLWPEHFDIAIEMGAEALGLRANYGVSPGDEDHPEPYVYVGLWAAVPTGALWNAKGFNGAELGYAGLAEAGDPLETALAFCLERRNAIEGLEAGG